MKGKFADTPKHLPKGMVPVEDLRGKIAPAEMGGVGVVGRNEKAHMEYLKEKGEADRQIFEMPVTKRETMKLISFYAITQAVIDDWGVELGFKPTEEKFLMRKEVRGKDEIISVYSKPMDPYFTSGQDVISELAKKVARENPDILRNLQNYWAAEYKKNPTKTFHAFDTAVREVKRIYDDKYEAIKAESKAEEVIRTGDFGAVLSEQ